MDRDDDRVLGAADRLHGLIRSRDLARLGVGRPQARRLVDKGLLTPVRRGVVLLGGGAPSDWQRAVAAWMVAGPEAALSHSTAARTHRFACVAPSDLIELSIAPSRRLAWPDCSIHRVHLSDADVVVRSGVVLTSPIRTVMDIASTLGPAALEKVVDEGLIAGLWDVTTLDTAVRSAARSRRPGLPMLRDILADRTGLPTGDTALEQRVVRVLACLASFEVGYQVVVDGQVFVLDLAWPEHQVGVECDGWHVRRRSRSKFDHDRRRNNCLLNRGWTVIHVTTAMSDDEIRGAVMRALLQAARAERGA